MVKTHPEHALQVRINRWVREHVAQPHFFTGIDRSAKTGQFTHVREKARGIVSGMSDTLLIVEGAVICVELKAPGNKPTDRQQEVGDAINKAGGIWDWTASVMGYAEILEAAGVPLIGQWRLAAERGDAVLLAAQIKADENKTGRVSRKRVQRPTATQVRKLNRMRAQVRF